MVNPGIDGAFPEWITSHDAAIARICAEGWQKKAIDAPKPLFSIIVPLFHTPIPFFHDMVRSVLAQTYEHWELVLVNADPDNSELAEATQHYDDGRIRILSLEQNAGIAGNTNAGIRAAKGNYIAFLDHDDMLDPHALELYARQIAAHDDIDLLYCDEDNFHESLSDRYSPIFKPDFNIDLLYSHNYVEHFLAISRHALNQIELSPDDVSGAQDYDLTLKVAEVARRIYHAPYLLYHWRAHAGSTNGGIMDGKPYAIEASVRALNRHFDRLDIAVRAHETKIPCVFRISYAPSNRHITAIIPFRSEMMLARALWCLDTQAAASRTSVIAIGHHIENTKALPRDIAVSLLPWNDMYDYAAMVNKALESVSPDDRLLLCRDGLQAMQANCLDQLDGALTRKDIGVAAPKAFYADGLVQHAGIRLGTNGAIGFLNTNFQKNMGGGYLGLAECCCDYSAVGPECLMVRADDLLATNGLENKYNNTLLSVVDLCFKLQDCDKGALILPDVQITTLAPVLDYGQDAIAAYGSTEAVNDFWAQWCKRRGKDILANPSYSLESGYPTLACGRDIETETERLCTSSLGSRLMRKFLSR